MKIFGKLSSAVLNSPRWFQGNEHQNRAENRTGGQSEQAKHFCKAYEQVAIRASTLYLAVADLGKLDPMYQYSLEWFIGLFPNASVS